MFSNFSHFLKSEKVWSTLQLRYNHKDVRDSLKLLEFIELSGKLFDGSGFNQTGT